MAQNLRDQPIIDVVSILILLILGKLAPQAGFVHARDERSEPRRELETAWGANSLSGWLLRLDSNQQPSG